MFLTNPRKQKPRSPEEEDEIRSNQKRCPKCGSVVSRELERCPFCGNAPWKWHPNSRFFIVTLIICLLLFVVFPLLTNREKSYRVPVTEEDTKP